MGNAVGIFTTEITNQSITVQETDGISKISVFNGTAVAGTVLGDRKAFARNPDAITVEEDETVTIVPSNGNTIKGVVITAPIGCTLKIMAS